MKTPPPPIPQRAFARTHRTNPAGTALQPPVVGSVQCCLRAVAESEQQARWPSNADSLLAVGPRKNRERMFAPPPASSVIEATRSVLSTLHPPSRPPHLCCHPLTTASANNNNSKSQLHGPCIIMNVAQLLNEATPDGNGESHHAFTMAQPVASVEGLLSPDTPEEQHALHSFADAIPGAEAGEGAGARLRSPTLQDLIDVAAQELRAMQDQNHSASPPPSPVQSPTGVAAAMPEWDGTSREKLQHQYRCEMEDVRASLYLVEGALRDIRAQNRRRWSTQMDVIRSIAITAPDAVGEGQTVGGLGGFDGAGAGMMMDFAAAAAENGGDDANAAAGLAFAHQHNAHHGHGQHYPFNDGVQGHAGGALTDMGSMTSRQSFSSTSSDPATSFSEQDGFASAPTAADIYPISPLEAAQHDGSAGDTTTTNLEQHDSHEKPVQSKKSKSKKKTLRPVKPKAALSPPTTTGAKRRQASNNRPMPVKKAGKSGGNATATRSKVCFACFFPGGANVPPGADDAWLCFSFSVREKGVLNRCSPDSCC